MPARPTDMGRRLRALADRCGCPTMSDFASHVGVPYSTISAWCREDEPALIRKLRKIKRVCGCTWEELLGP